MKSDRVFSNPISAAESSSEFRSAVQTSQVTSSHLEACPAPLQSNSLEGFIGGKYQIIYADPPWHFKTYSKKGQKKSPSAHYPTMSLKELKELPIADIADRNALLFLWVYTPSIPQALEVMQAWGFTYKTIGFNWVKTSKHNSENLPLGCGFYTRKQTELCLIGRRGKSLKRLRRNIGEVILQPRRQHSRKPDEVREMIDLMYAGLKLELFSRTRVPGWAAHGNELGLF